MRVVAAIVIALFSAMADAAVLHGMRLWEGPDGTRVVLDVDAQTKFDVFSLSNPDRVVIDLPGMGKDPKFGRGIAARGLVKDVRTGPHGDGVRVVLDLSAPVNPKGFEMKPGGGYGYRVIVDLAPQGKAAPSPLAAATAAAVAAAGSGDAPQRSAAARPAALPEPRIQLRNKPIVIAVDAGHGGDDPGAQGPDGLQEKTVTLAIARRLAHLIDQQPNMKAVLTRDGDYYVGLRERTIKARQAQADLFVSIHCNANNDHQLHGTAVYVLSDHGASSEQARWLANRENAADLVGGVDLHDQDDKVAAVLIDISQTATMEASFDLGNRMLDSLGEINSLQKPRVQQAGFMVLKSPDIPSVLVETAYISNRREERLLGSSSYQEKLARGLLNGISGYFSNYRPQQQVAVVDDSGAQAKPMPVGLRGAEAARAARILSAN
jgi:N-acetylmuramoyl-L-alanine amidase